MLSGICDVVNETATDEPNTKISIQLGNETEDKTFVTLDRVVLNTWPSFICGCVLHRSLRTNPLTFFSLTSYTTWKYHSSTSRNWVCCTLYFSLYQSQLEPSRIKVNFKNSSGDLLKTVEVNEGDDILSIAHEHDIDLEGE